MKRIKIGLAAIIVISGVIAGCNKEAANQATGNSINATLASKLGVSVCDEFAYPDSVIYPKPQSKNYIVKPVNALSGKYGAFPAGLKINAVTGDINVSKSETGLEYIVWFIPTGTTDTCKKFLTVSGVNYIDSVYVMNNNSALAVPVYNASISAAIDCSAGCEFDDGPDDDNANGVGDEPPAGQELIPKGFVINKTTGVINFKKSIQNGVLGKNPLSGTSKEFTLNYRLGDKSNKALNRISFELFFYKNKSEIPQDLLEELSIKQGQVILEDEDDDDDDKGGGKGGGGKGPNINQFNLATASLSASKHGKGETKCRPPYIIVTQK